MGISHLIEPVLDSGPGLYFGNPIQLTMLLRWMADEPPKMGSASEWAHVAFHGEFAGLAIGARIAKGTADQLTACRRRSP